MQTTAETAAETTPATRAATPAAAPRKAAPATFSHTARPPSVTREGHCRQFETRTPSPRAPWAASALVYRMAGHALAAVRISTNSVFAEGSPPAYFNAAELRCLAARLIDAAHDLEAHPAAREGGVA